MKPDHLTAKEPSASGSQPSIKFLCAVLVAAALLSTSGTSVAHEIGARVDLPSKFERFVVPAGGVRFLQYYGIGQLEGPGETVRFRVGRVPAAGQPTALRALEIRVSSSSAASRALIRGTSTRTISSR